MASHSINVTHDGERKRIGRRRETNTSEEERRPWSDLHQDILRLLVQRLYITDRVNLRAVCKNWRLAPCFDQLPLLFNYYFSPNRITYSISDPYHRQPRIVHEKGSNVPTIGRLLCHAVGHASRSGWVLFSESRVDLKPTISWLQIDVFNPHTKALMSLPALEFKQNLRCFNHVINFTSAPTSPDCMFFVFTECDSSERMFVSTYSIRETAWKTSKFVRGHPPYCFSTRLTTYMDGSFYFYDVRGHLSCFHIATQKCRLVSVKHPLRNESDNLRRCSKCYLVAYGGDLLLVYLTDGHTIDAREVVGCDIFRYDWVIEDWKKMESLEGGALYLGEDQPSFGVSVTSDDEETNKLLGNRVYYIPSAGSKSSFLVYGSGSTLAMEKTSESIESESLRWSGKGESRAWMWIEP